MHDQKYLLSVHFSNLYLCMILTTEFDLYSIKVNRTARHLCHSVGISGLTQTKDRQTVETYTYYTATQWQI